MEEMDQQLSHQVKKGFHGAVWSAENKLGVKNMALCWDKEVVN